MFSNIKTYVFISMALLCFSLITPRPIRYVALGDSYTICTGATEAQSWPVLLTKQLKENAVNIELIANPSHNGWTTQDVIENELPVFDRSNANFVTLLIGVNDWVQGVDATRFKARLVKILDHVQNKLPEKNKVILITIPDFGVTSTGARYSGGRDISAGIAEFNSIILAEAKKRGLKTVDLFPTSKEMGKDARLVAKDGLHPSAKEYAIWEKLIYPVVFELLK